MAIRSVGYANPNLWQPQICVGAHGGGSLLTAHLTRHRLSKGTNFPMRLYTRKGDSGQTSIWGGRRLSKDDPRMEAIGAVDECNAAIGSALAIGLPGEVDGLLQTVQARLFVVGSELMAPDRTGGGGSLPRLNENDVLELEAAIDSIESQLPELPELHPSRGQRRGGIIACSQSGVPPRRAAGGHIESS
jgi:ATP:cob(I)alamin adenosyltransferase